MFLLDPDFPSGNGIESLQATLAGQTDMWDIKYGNKPEYHRLRMFLELFAVTSGFLYVGDLLRGLVRGILGSRNLHGITSHLMPGLPSPHMPYLLDAPISSLEILEQLGMPSTSEGFIVAEVPSLVLPSSIPTPSYELSLDIVTPNRIPELAHLFSLLVLFTVFVFLLPGLVYVSVSIARNISAITRLARKFFKAFIFKSIFALVSVSSLVPLCGLVLLFSLLSDFFSTRIFFLRLFIAPVSLPLWSRPPAIASFITSAIIFMLPTYQILSNMIVNISQRLNKTVTSHKFIWWRKLPSEPNQDQAPIYTAVCTASSHLELQHCKQELVNSLTQHKPEKEQEKRVRLKTQKVNASFADAQKSLRRRLHVSHTREAKLKALVATLEASVVALRAKIATNVDETRNTTAMLDQQLAEKDQAIRSTNNDSLAMRTKLQDAEDKIARLDAELCTERELQIHMTKELNETAKTRRLYEAQMRRISEKTEHVQILLDLIDDLLPQSHARMKSSLEAHIPYPTSYTIGLAPDDAGEPPPPLIDSTILNVRTPLRDFNTNPCSLPPSSLLHTPKRTRSSHDHSRQISAWLDRVSNTANSWLARGKSLLDTISRLETERSWEVESRERSERRLQEELSATKEKLGVTQEELSSTMQALGVTQEELIATKERLHLSQNGVSKANHELDRERETHHVTRAQADDTSRELEKYRAKLKEVQDTRRAVFDKFCKAVELLRQRNAVVENLRAEAKTSKSKHLKASSTLGKRVKIFDVDVNSLTLNQMCEEILPAHADSPFPCPVDPDPKPTHSAGYASFDSLPPPSPPPPSLPRNSLIISDSLSTIISLDNATPSLDPPQRLDLSPTHHPPPPFRSGIQSPSRASSLAYLPVGSCAGSVDWPPTGPTLLPSVKNAGQDSGVNVLEMRQLPHHEADHTTQSSSTIRNPLNFPPQIMTGKSLVFGNPIHHFGVRGSTSVQSINVAGMVSADKLTPAAHHDKFISASGSAPSSPSHTPSGSPPMPRKGLGGHALKRSTRSPPVPPLPRLGLLNPTLIREHAALDEGCPRTFGKLDRTRHPNRYCAYTRHRIQPLDYGLPDDFIPGTECTAIKHLDRELKNAGDDNDFAFIIPLDCVTSTPVALSRRLASKRLSPEPVAKIPGLRNSPPNLTPPPKR